jgi:hypothetical protein
MAISSTVLFFPFLETYLMVFKKDLGYADPVGDLDGSAVFLTQSIAYLIIFYFIVLTFSLLRILSIPKT